MTKIIRLLMFLKEKCGNQTFELLLNVEELVQFPAYPENHGSTLECRYTLRAPNGTRIRFWIDSFGVGTYSKSLFYIEVKQFDFLLQALRCNLAKKL